MAEYLLIDPAVLNSGAVYRLTGNGIRAAIAAASTTGAAPRGRFYVLNANDLQDVLLIDAGTTAPVPTVVEVEPPTPATEPAPAP